uniref:Putative viral protein found on panstrongylus sialotranscriptome n=1 Tax=Panstrongylus megistus TaxID=65343 RepID=A0A069DXW6_9HEMI
MDCSNPVVDSTRCTVETMMQGLKRLKRQDLQYLRELGDSGRRALINKADPEKIVIQSALERIPPVELGSTALDEQDVPCTVHRRSIPPASLKRSDGSEVRSSVANLSDGRVSVNRYFGQGKVATRLVSGLLRSYNVEDVVEAFKTSIYTSGTVAGFLNRLEIMNTRDCVSIKKDPTQLVPGKVSTLRQLLPVGALKSWHSEDLSDLLSEVRTSRVASAGAPYWRPKGQAMADILEVGIPAFVEAMKAGVQTFGAFMEENPEMFVLECKNKTDRYDIAKLEDKTRPYFNTPAHISLLQSCLMQPFCESLLLFHEAKRSRNAYGYTLAKGGGRKLWDKINQSLKTKEPFFFAYGDDVDLYVPIDGKMYRVAPDFKQMDYSVDYDTMELTLDYMKAEYVAQHGRNQFWETFIEYWKGMLKYPRFLVQGKTIFSKESDGLMSGVVGTTLFDTVKSVISYERYLVHLQQIGRGALHDEAQARRFFESQGLEIKAGTWSPEVVDLNLVPGTIRGNTFNPGRLPSNNKFLGVQMMPVEGPKGLDFVPYLPEKDWLQCLATPRDDPGEKGSKTAELRTHFDRMRGYLVTGAIFSPRAHEYCYGEIDRLPSDVILMQTQSEGLGEIQQIVGQEFEFPTSESIPNVKWVFDIYASEDNRFEAEPTQLFEERVMNAVQEHRLIDRRIRLEMKGKQVIQMPDLNKVELPDLGLPDMVKSYVPKVVEATRLANKPIVRFAQQASEFVGQGVAAVPELASLLGVSAHKCAALLHEEGFFMREMYGEIAFSQYPIVFEGERDPIAAVAKQETTAIQENSPKKENIGAPKLVKLPVTITEERPLPGLPQLKVKHGPNFNHARTIIDRIAVELGRKFHVEWTVEPFTVGEGSNKKGYMQLTAQAGFEGLGPFLKARGPSKSAITTFLYKRIVELNDAKVALLATAATQMEPAIGFLGGEPISNAPEIAEPIGPPPFHQDWAEEVVTVPVEAPAHIRTEVEIGGIKSEVELDEVDGVIRFLGPVSVSEMQAGEVKLPNYILKALRKFINKRNDDWKKADRRSKTRAAKAQAPKGQIPESRGERRTGQQGRTQNGESVSKGDNCSWQRPTAYNSQRSKQERGSGTNRAQPRKSPKA